MFTNGKTFIFPFKEHILYIKYNETLRNIDNIAGSKPGIYATENVTYAQNLKNSYMETVMTDIKNHLNKNASYNNKKNSEQRILEDLQTIDTYLTTINPISKHNNTSKTYVVKSKTHANTLKNLSNEFSKFKQTKNNNNKTKKMAQMFKQYNYIKINLDDIIKNNKNNIKDPNIIKIMEGIRDQLILLKTTSDTAALKLQTFLDATYKQLLSNEYISEYISGTNIQHTHNTQLNATSASGTSLYVKSPNTNDVNSDV